MQSRYSLLSDKLADKIAGEMHRTLDARVVQQLQESFAADAGDTGEARDIASMLRLWTRSARLTQWSLLGLAAVTAAASVQHHQLANAIPLLLWLSHRNNHIVKQSLPLVKALARIEAAHSATALAYIWGRSHPQQLSQLEAATTTTDDSPKLFDWAQLRDPDKFVHLLFLGETGSGKTYTAERVMEHIGCDFKVITSKRKADQWRNRRVIGTPRDFDAIRDALEQDMVAMVKRMGNLDASWPMEFTVIDELSAIAKNVKDAGYYFSSFICEARETRMRYAFLAHGQQVKLLGLQGQSDLIDGLCKIRLGASALEHAHKLAHNRMYLPTLEYVKAQERPLMVNDYPAKI